MYKIISAYFLMTAALTSRVLAADTLSGTYALPNGKPQVSATLFVTPDSGLQRTLDIAITPVGGTRPIVRYESELSKQLHAIAISSDLRDFVHEHGDRPGADGHFHIPMVFPHAGSWYVFADAVPQGLGQQVLRFDLPLGGRPPEPRSPGLTLTGTRSADGDYSVQFDAFELKAGRESHLTLHLLHDGKPADDVTPFLGVAAHAVFINASDLSYVHVHAAPAKAPTAGGTGAPAAHETTGTSSLSDTADRSAASAHDEMGGREGMGAPLSADMPVPSELTMHVQAPKAGTYVLWIQFDGGGKVRTVRFVVPVTA